MRRRGPKRSPCLRRLPRIGAVVAVVSLVGCAREDDRDAPRRRRASAVATVVDEIAPAESTTASAAPTTTTTTAATSAPSVSCAPSAKAVGSLDFDKGAVLAALKSVHYGHCTVASSAGRTGSVTLAFAGSGGVDAASVWGPYSAREKACIEAEFKTLRVPPFGKACTEVGWKIH